MSCPDCDDDRVTLVVPAAYREFAPDESAHVSVCRTCLQVRPATDAETADATTLGDWLPAGDAGVGVVLLVALLDSLALNRSQIEALVVQVERDGADPLLALDRLAASAEDGRVDPHVDLARRRPQLQQFLGE